MDICSKFSTKARLLWRLIEIQFFLKSCGYYFCKQFVEVAQKAYWSVVFKFHYITVLMSISSITIALCHLSGIVLLYMHKLNSTVIFSSKRGPPIFIVSATTLSSLGALLFFVFLSASFISSIVMHGNFSEP